MIAAVIVIVVIAYLAVHHHHYRRNRRHGLSFWVSCRGPFGTRISKRL